MSRYNEKEGKIELKPIVGRITTPALTTGQVMQYIGSVKLRPVQLERRDQ